jgi:hypothetical protein
MLGAGSYRRRSDRERGGCTRQSLFVCLQQGFSRVEGNRAPEASIQTLARSALHEVATTAIRLHLRHGLSSAHDHNVLQLPRTNSGRHALHAHLPCESESQYPAARGPGPTAHTLSARRAIFQDRKPERGAASTCTARQPCPERPPAWPGTPSSTSTGPAATSTAPPAPAPAPAPATTTTTTAAAAAAAPSSAAATTTTTTTTEAKPPAQGLRLVQHTQSQGTIYASHSSSSPSTILTGNSATKPARHVAPASLSRFHAPLTAPAVDEDRPTDTLKTSRSGASTTPTQTLASRRHCWWQRRRHRRLNPPPTLPTLSLSYSHRIRSSCQLRPSALFPQ